MQLLALLVLVAALMGCASIEHTATAKQPLDQIALAETLVKFPMDGYVIEILKASPNSIEYRLTKQ